MTVSAFISDDDGYSEEAYIDAIERMHPAVRFKYRPIRVLDRVQIVGELRDLNAKGKAQNAESLIAQEIANRIFSWDFLDSNGSVIDGAPEPTKKSVLRIKPQLFVRLADIVIYGNDAGDLDPALDPDLPSRESPEDSAKN